jgi:chemotaxis signal transduction protein
MSEHTDAEERIEESAETINSEKFLVFSIVEKYYCFPSRLIGEIALFDAVYPLPLMPSYILGIVNRYSTPYALFDTGLLLQRTPCPRKKVLILKEEIDRVAFLIDDITAIANIKNEEIFTIEKKSDSDEFADGINASFKWNDSDVFVLDANKIINRVSEELL